MLNFFFFNFDIELMRKTVKTSGFNEKHTFAHFVRSVFRFYASSLTETQYLQIERTEKGTHTNKNMILKSFTVGICQMNKEHMIRAYKKEMDY